MADPDADAALLAGVRETPAPSVELDEVDAHVKDPSSAIAARHDEFLGGAR